MRRQLWHSPHGSPVFLTASFSQLRAIARTRASVVLPVPRGPQKRYPCATRPFAIAPWSVAETCDWTATSANFRGRYLRASERAIDGKLLRECVRREQKKSRGDDVASPARVPQA